jgi:hypothetical protein
MAVELAPSLGLTACADGHSINHKGQHVSQNNPTQKSDSAADAWAIFALIAIAVATAVFWVSNH